MDNDVRPQLRRGVWHDGVLLLEAANPLPEGLLTLVIAGTDAPATLTVNAEAVSGHPSPEAAAILDSKAVPVWLRIDTPEGPVETTPVYPYHPASLANMLTGRRDPDLLRKTGSLDLEAHDEDLAARAGRARCSPNHRPPKPLAPSGPQRSSRYRRQRRSAAAVGRSRL